MTVPGTLANLSVFWGEDKTLQDTIYQSDGSTVQNITGWLITFVVTAYGNPEAIFITKTVGDGITLSNPTQGVLQIALGSEDTLVMRPGEYSYEIRRTGAGAESMLTYGLFTILGSAIGP